MNLTKIYFSSSFEKYIKITKKLFFWVNIYIPLLILQDLQSSETWKVIFSFSLVVLYNEVIKRTSSLFIYFFFLKRFCAHNNMSHPEVYARVKNCCLCCFVLVYFCFVCWFSLVACFCACEIYSSKKIKKKKKTGLKLSW